MIFRLLETSDICLLGSNCFNIEISLSEDHYSY